LVVSEQADLVELQRPPIRPAAAKTLERYRGIVRDHLIPELGGIPLARISAAKVNDRMIPRQRAARSRDARVIVARR
jgi:hypothetical protein